MSGIDVAGLSAEARREIASVFGREALDDLLAKKAKDSDRVPEGWARRNGGPLPDMRKGRGAVDAPVATGPIITADPRDGTAESSDGFSVLDHLHAQAKGGKRRLAPSAVPMEWRRHVLQKSGKKVETPHALNKDEYDAAQATLVLDAAERAEEAARRRTIKAARQHEAALLKLPFAGDVPGRLRPVQDQARLFAAGTTVNPYPRRADEVADEVVPVVEAVCDECGWTDCLCGTRRPAMPTVADFVRELEAIDDSGGDDDDGPAWMLRYAEEIAEDEFADVWAEAHADNERWDRERLTTADEEMADLCVKCHKRPMRTKKDGLCRNCKRRPRKGVAA